MCIYPVFFCVLFRFRLSLYGTIVTEFFYCDNLMPSTCKVALLLLGIFAYGELILNVHTHYRKLLQVVCIIYRA